MQQYSDSSTFEFIAQIPIEALLLIVEDLLVADYFFEKKTKQLCFVKHA